MLSGRGLCDELITRPEESYRPWCVVVCDLETLRIGAPYIYIYDISSLRVKYRTLVRLNKCCILRRPGGERIMDNVPGGTELELQLRRGVGQAANFSQ